MPSVDLGNVIGQTGATGAQGENGAQGKGFTARGEWVGGNTYNNNATTIDFVYYGGSSYYCKETVSSTITPDLDTQHWGLIVGGIVRKIFNCTLRAIDWQTTSSAVFPYTITKTISHNTGETILDPNGIFDLYMNNRIREEYGIVFGSASESTNYASITLYAKRLYASDLNVKIYTDETSIEVIND